jgi:non-heme chloroperoxidase
MTTLPADPLNILQGPIEQSAGCRRQTRVPLAAAPAGSHHVIREFPVLKPLRCLVLAAGCAATAAHGQTAPAAQPRTRMVTTAPGVTLEVIDWGGTGRPLVFLPGGGLSAHQFDDFAPPLAAQHRVLAISRRGSGASSDVPPDSLRELVDDIVAVLDSLHLPSAVLVGHSFAGVEMALFGETHPGRCDGLVYLDAAYDYIDPGIERVFTETPPPSPPPMTAADSASFGAVRAYGERINAFRMPDSEIRRLHRWDAGGRMVERLVSATQRRQGALMRTPRWEAVRCPSLGIYPVPAPLETRPPAWFRELDAAQRAAGEAYVREFGRWTAAQRAKFGSVPGNRVIEFPSSNHYFFLEKPDEARRMILDFAASLP